MYGESLCPIDEVAITCDSSNVKLQAVKCFEFE